MNWTEQEYQEWLKKPSQRIMDEGKRKRVNRQLEFEIQRQVALYIKLQYPFILWTASTEGMKLSFYLAKKLKAMGYQAGTPDILIFEPRHSFKALFLEMKSKGGTQSEKQKLWQKNAEWRGYKYELAYSFEEAKDILDSYLKGDSN